MKHGAILIYFGLIANGWCGGWVSSGGQFLRDKSNPWFLKNVSTVNACLTLDQASFSIPRGRAKDLLLAAIDYWKGEFARLDQSLGIASQQFLISEAPCTGVEDIEFRLGYGALNPEENKYFQDSQQDLHSFVGVSLRKSYDVPSLRGRGAVIFASDSGPQRFQNGRGVPDRFWQNEGLFLRAAIHEMGHVLGLPHEVSGLMGERYPEEMIRRFHEGRTDLRLTDNLAPFFTIPDRVRLNWASGKLVELNSVFLMDSVQLSFTGNRIELQSQPSPLQPARLPGGTLAARIVADSMSQSLESPIQVFLPAGQTVFPSAPANTFIMGPMRVRRTLTGVIDATDATPKIHLIFNVEPTTVSISAVSDLNDGLQARFSVGSQ